MNNENINPDIQKRFIDLLSDYEDKHSKVQVIRFDLRYPQNYNYEKNNMHISRCMAKIKQWSKRKGYDPVGGWVREQNESDHPHYHAILLQDGQKVNNPYPTFIEIKKLWGNTIKSNEKGLIHCCNKNKDGSYRRNGEVHNRNNRPDDVDRQLAYLAKQDGKGQPKDGVRNFGVSRRKKQS